MLKSKLSPALIIMVMVVVGGPIKEMGRSMVAMIARDNT
jgi:hypothetical protein